MEDLKNEQLKRTYLAEKVRKESEAAENFCEKHGWYLDELCALRKRIGGGCGRPPLPPDDGRSILPLANTTAHEVGWLSPRCEWRLEAPLEYLRLPPDCPPCCWRPPCPGHALQPCYAVPTHAYCIPRGPCPRRTRRHVLADRRCGPPCRLLCA